MTEREEFIRLLKASRIVAAVKDADGLENVLKCPCNIVFILHGDIVNIPGIVAKIKAANKLVFVHIDLIDGLASRDVAVDFIGNNTKADGIISTKPNIIKCAKALGLLTVQRFFILDSMALNNLSKQLSNAADAIEILPGVIPKVIKTLARYADKPIIAGGLITDKEDALGALNAGASAISTSNRTIWI